MAEIDVSAVQKEGDGATFEGWLDNFSPDVERAGKELLQCLRNPQIRAICVRGYEGYGSWRIVEYAARKLKGSDLFDVQIIVKLPKEDWSPRNVQREIANRLGIKEGDDEDGDVKNDVQREVSFEIDESLKGKRFLLILGDATRRIYLDDVGVANIRNTKVVYASSERLESEEIIEFQDFSIDVLREEAVAVTSSPTIAACFTPHVVLDCFFYLLLFSVSFERSFEMVLPTRYWIAEGIMVFREGIEEEEDLIILEKKVYALLIELKARSMVEQVDADVRVPPRLAEKAIDMVMSSNRIASTHGKFWIHYSSLPTENIGEWEDIQRMAIWNLQPSDDLPLTLKFPKLSTLLLEGGRTRTLPNNFVFEQMQGLRVLILSFFKIRFLPLSISSLHNFRFLSIYRCELLEPESLLSSLQALDKLEFLQFERTPLKSIPDECLQHKNNLRSLHLSNTETRSLPSSFPQLHNLQQLSITTSSSLTEIPDAFFERLPRLRVLNLAHDDNLKSLPPSLSKLVNLRQLILTGCSSLKSKLLPHLRKLYAALEVLDISSCNSIEDIEEVSSSLGAVLPNLQKLDLSRIKVIKQVILKGCRSLESLRLSDLTRLDVLDLSGTQLQQLPDGISTASHLTRLDMLHMNHIRKINWDDLPTELEELNFGDRGTFNSPKDDENPSDEGGTRMRICNYKLLRSLKPSSEVLRAKCFSRFHIRISPYQEEEEEGRRRGKGIHLQGRKSIYEGINLKTQKCNLPLPSSHFDRHLEIQGSKRCTNAIQGVLRRTELLTLWDNGFIRDLGDVEMHEVRECLVKSCEQMEIFFGGKNQCFECLEKIWMSDLASMRRVCDGMGRIISFPLLKHIYLEHCPRLVNFVSSGVSLLSLEKLEIRFCNRLESLFQGDVVVDGSLERLHTVHLWELPKLDRICSGRYLSALKKLIVRGCGKLKELPLRAGPYNAIRGGGGVQVGGEMAWWENLRWEDESIKDDIHFIEWRPRTRR
ncbi:putative disease resistance protein At4g19050 [Magnolia sinica]|uniref:putative disease resistance protein At4g19050 n=1 Tax=Magnolia sinica TaxID=86752 RepID=UPI00265966B6|nr:putative disease resistance protein At4g19050 [Magnolia sinica]